MDKKKQTYETPVVETWEVKLEGIICASKVKSGNSINSWGDGATTNDDFYM